MNTMTTLGDHQAIGWDIDGTLVDNPLAPRLHTFIMGNPGIRHCLVTFRTHGLVDAIERDLAHAGLRDMSVFDDVFTVPESLWMQWAVVQSRRTARKVSGKLLLPEIQYMEWKGFVCRQMGLTALVDDDLQNTQRGCTRYKVELFDTNAL